MSLSAPPRRRIASTLFAQRPSIRTPLSSCLRAQQRAYSNQQWQLSRFIRTFRQSHPFRPFRNLRSNSTRSDPTPNPTPHLGSPEPTSLSARLKKLSREYGWSALGVYLGLSALDFPFCFLAVRWLGTERIGYAEHIVIEAFWNVVEKVMPDARSRTKAVEEAVGETTGVDLSAEERESGGWGVEEAQARNKSHDANIWTQLALAYAIHKSFIFVRVPLTAAVTPKVVKTLRGWGWNIGKRKPKTPSVKKD